FSSSLEAPLEREEQLHRPRALDPSFLQALQQLLDPLQRVIDVLALAFSDRDLVVETELGLEQEHHVQAVHARAPPLERAQAIDDEILDAEHAELLAAE